MENIWHNEIVAAAAKRGGVVLTSDLADMGLASDDVARAVMGLTRLRRGAYVIESAMDPREHYRQRTRAAALQHPGDPVISHVSAAAIHGFAVHDRHTRWVHLTLARARGGRRNGVHTHLAHLSPADFGRIDEIATTSPTRTVIDCARQLPLVEAVVIADQALSLRMASHSQLKSAAHMLGRLPGGRRARLAISMADPGGQSPGETRTRLILVQGGFDVNSQVVMRDRRGRFVARVDLALGDSLVVIEFDGRLKYGLDGDIEGAHWNEKLRHDKLQEAGLVVVRVTWRDLADPSLLIERVRQAKVRADRMRLLS